MGFLYGRSAVRHGLVSAPPVGTMLTDPQNILQRLGKADRAHQQEGGWRLQLRSITDVLPVVLLAFNLDVVFRLSAGVRVGGLVGTTLLLVAILGYASFIAFVRRCRLGHIARFLESQDPA